MTKIYMLFMAVITGLFAISCDKEEPYVYDRQSVLERESPTLASYVNMKGLLPDSARFDRETGIWYVLQDSGRLAVNYLDSTSVPGKIQLKNLWVKVRYKTQLLDSTVVEHTAITDSVSYIPLLGTDSTQGQIQAWQLAFYPKAVGGLLEDGLKIGARIRVITPSIYGYQDQVHGIIKENSPLDLEVEVLDVRTNQPDSQKEEK